MLLPMAIQERATGRSFDPPAGYWQREASHNPKPLTPLGASLFIDGVNQSFRKVFADFGLLVETLEFREIGGYVYTSAKPFGVGSQGGGNLPPRPVLWLVLRLHPAFRARIKRCKAAIRSRLDQQLIGRWINEWRPRLIDDIARLRAVDLSALSDEALAGHLDELRRWLFQAFDIHFYLTAANGFPLGRLIFFCRDHLGYDDMQTLRLMSGLSSASSEPALELARVADSIKSDAALHAAVLACAPGDVASVLRDGGPEAARPFDAYLEHYGCRALRYEVVEPTLGEQPEMVGRLLQDQLRREGSLQVEQEQLASEREAAKRQALAALPDEALRSQFLTLVEECARGYPVREDNEFFTVSVPLALARFVVLEATRRLVSRGAIAIEGDVFFLQAGEIADALRGVAGQSVQRVSERRDAFQAALASDPPASFGTEPPQPPLDVLPAEARQATEVVVYMQTKVFEAEQSGRRAQAGARELAGRAAARGTYTGTARIVLGEHEFDRLRAGDVLVCPITSPVWSVLFAKVGALVTDSGGILSHPAIIAREYGIPAVVATGNGTQIIPDGARVAVDGDAGVVRLLD